MQLDTLTAISPIDGRYRSKCEPLADYFSEYALIRYRVRVEVEYFIALCEIPLPQLAGVDHSVFRALRAIYTGFTEADAAAVKEIERTTNHDVKAVEYFLKQRFDALGLEAYKEFIHFGLTSQDINNTAVPMSIREALHNVYLPLMERLQAELDRMAAGFAHPSGQGDRRIRLSPAHAAPVAQGRPRQRQVRRRHRQLQRPSDSIPHNRLAGFRRQIP